VAYLEDFPQAAQVLRSQLDILRRQLGSGAVPEQSCFAHKSKQLKTLDSDWIGPQGANDLDHLID
jgi:hypothetical protein